MENAFRALLRDVFHEVYATTVARQMDNQTLENQSNGETSPEHTSPRSFSPGDLISSYEPWTWCLTWTSYWKYCAYCLTDSEELRKCSGCKLHRYCDSKCQTLDWKGGHKEECSLLKNIDAQIGALDTLGNNACDSINGNCRYGIVSGGTSVIMLLKILRKAKMNDVGGPRDQSISELLRSFPVHPPSGAMDQLSKNTERVLGNGRVQELTAQFTPSQPFPGVEECMKIIYSNTFPILDPVDKSTAIGAVLVPHSPHLAMTPVCWDANVVIGFYGRKLLVHATEEIGNYQKLSDLRYSERVMNQFNMILPERREWFRILYGHPCSCRKCTPKYEAEMNPLKCVTAACMERIPSDRRARAPCPQCGAVNTDRLTKFRQFMDRYNYIINNIYYDAELQAQTALWNEMNASGILHGDAHILFVYGYNQAGAYGLRHGYEKAWKLFRQFIPSMRSIYPQYHAHRARCLMTAAGCALGLKGQIDADTMDLIKEVFQIYSKLYGTDSKLAETARKLIACAEGGPKRYRR